MSDTDKEIAREFEIVLTKFLIAADNGGVTPDLRTALVEARAKAKTLPDELYFDAMLRAHKAVT